MYPTCILICILVVSYMHPVCILDVSYMHPICILYVSYMYPICIRASTLRVDPGHSLHPTSWPWPEPPPYELTLATASNLRVDPGHCPRECAKGRLCPPRRKNSEFLPRRGVRGNLAAFDAAGWYHVSVRIVGPKSVSQVVVNLFLFTTRTLHRTAVREKHIGCI